jgi:hypothetical protein
MGDEVASGSRVPLKRQRSATFSPFADGDAVPSFMSFGASVFANEIMSDFTPSAFARFDDDGVGSAGGMGGGAFMPRQPINDIGDWNQLEPLCRTRSGSSIKQLLEEDDLAHVTPAFGRTPRGRTEPSGITPRCRQDLEHVDSLKLELVGTTLVAKIACDDMRLDVGLVLLGAVASLQLILSVAALIPAL